MKIKLLTQLYEIISKLEKANDIKLFYDLSFRFKYMDRSIYVLNSCMDDVEVIIYNVQCTYENKTEFIIHNSHDLLIALLNLEDE